jgi:hypothetical protein
MIPPDGTFILFIRHGERAPLPPDDPYADVDLTPAGYAAVAALAQTLFGRIHWTATSPFHRCRVTARGLGFDPEDDTRLGQHGPWVVCHEAAGREFAVRGTEGVVRAQIAGIELVGLRGPEVAVPLLLSAGLDRASRGSGVLVTHDAVLMPAIAALTGERFQRTWLAPLDGFALVLERGAMYCHFHGCRSEVTL